LKNILKEKVKQKKVVFGGYISMAHPDVAEVIGAAGYDWVLFDTEHAPLDVATIQMLMQAMRFSQTPTLVRVAWNDMVLIKRALDIGTSGIIVPWVNSREDAMRAVSAMRYPPAGLRGVGPRRAAIIDPEYIETANKELFLAIQIETKQAIDRVDEILSVEGIDAAFIGPYDLSFSLGVPRQWESPIFTNAVKRVLEGSTRHNVAPGVLAPVEWEKRMREGFRMIQTPGDIDILQQGAAENLRKMRDFASTLR
jgi:2-dehydro-3-deoxyglucarate aldolase